MSEPKKPFRRVILESPYAGHRALHDSYVTMAIRHSVMLRESPYASHVMLTASLDDKVPIERFLGIDRGWMWHSSADLIVFYGDFGISGGMWKTAAEVAKKPIPVACRTILPEEMRRIDHNEIISFRAALLDDLRAWVRRGEMVPCRDSCVSIGVEAPGKKYCPHCAGVGFVRRPEKTT